ncbi:C4-dicarboxylate transport protein 2 [Methylobacterium marchantiae]|nr:C4-dicarboxylate transport protein 2 [Methylobacterium marchantiae]
MILAVTFNAVLGIPAIGLVLVLSVDWFVGMVHAVGNLVGSCVATVAVTAWEGDLDREWAHRVLNGGQSSDTASN